MKFQIFSCAALFIISAPVMASGIPGDAKVIRELDCVAQLDAQYAAVTKVVIRDVNYRIPSSPLDTNNSVLGITLADGSVQEGVMNASDVATDNDPEQSRDSAPNSSGWGGIGFYSYASSTGTQLVFVTKGASDQSGLAVRQYGFSVIQAVGDAATPISQGKLTCQLKR